MQMTQSSKMAQNSEMISGSKVPWGLTGSTLKMIAMISMFIDHVGAAVLARMILQFWELQELVPYDVVWKWFPWLLDPDKIYDCYNMTRSIGRIAFPIYCFLLIEGFLKTRSHKKYALRLGAFALLSEIPFDLAFQSRWMGFGAQNVFFTLLIGMFTMMLCEWASKRKWSDSETGNKVLGIIGFILFTATGALLAEFIRADYGAIGILCIMVLYLFRYRRRAQMLAGALSFYWELPAPLAFIPIAFYNNQKGWNLKYIFYVFYPLHLLLLYILCILLGIGNISAI